MMLVKKHGIINDNKEIADIINNYFVNMTKYLGLKRNIIHVSQSVESIFHVFRHHKSI